eukprot:CAMPEP_0197437710 /NCGR_PEP_ID=MMETSP1175-20131217/4886_1 /TAXON_ID=1003142 /ORGANISM="Triceratium dubium, Strain CCMP147" /LENGTH=325 /DNA_ID=CAMNT_0042967297 /DNA_START=35 /DNA_END=1012 /DNA_ORIENTATION=-
MPYPTLRCDPKLFEKDLTGYVAIVTGANSGCGLETSRQLSKQGATVVLACRSAERGKAAAEDVGGSFLAPLDLASLASVRSFTDAFLAKYDRLDILVNNAGIMACPKGKTKDGNEMQIGCNHLAHFLLLRLLTSALLKTAETTGKPSRFVALSSCAAAQTTGNTTVDPDIDFDDLNWEKREYDEWKAYSASKLANYLTAMSASSKFSSEKLISTGVHPGWVYSPLDKHAMAQKIGEGWIAEKVGSLLKNMLYWKGDIISPADGAQTTLHCILDDEVVSGKFYSQKGIYKDEASQAGGWPMVLPNPNATEEKAEKLWSVSEKLVGL